MTEFIESQKSVYPVAVMCPCVGGQPERHL